MAQAEYLIDTNAIIDYLGGNLPVSGLTFLEKIMFKSSQVSVITKIELLGFNTTKEHAKTLSDFVNELKVLEISNEIVEEIILIRKNRKIKLPDAINSATAITQNSNLITRNISDFKSLKNLKTINPHSFR